MKTVKTTKAKKMMIKYVAILRCENPPPDHQSFSATLESATKWADRTLEDHPGDKVEIFELKQELVATVCSMESKV